MASVRNARRYASLLRESALFNGLPETEIQEIVGFSNLRYLAAQQTLFWQGDPTSWFYYVVGGTVKLTRRDAKSRRYVLGLVNPRQLVGEDALFSRNGYPATAVAAKESEVLAIQAAPFIRLLRRHSDLAWRFLAHLNRTIDGLIGIVEYLATHPADERVARYLMERFDARTPDAALKDLPDRRSDLAGVLSLTKETLCRVLGRFRRQGWIEARGGHIVVRRPERLEALLDGQADPLVAARGTRVRSG